MTTNWDGLYEITHLMHTVGALSVSNHVVTMNKNNI